MALTEIQRMAISRAQVGDWDLADAMELLERMRRTTVISAERIGGRLAVLNHGEVSDYECDDCAGKGTVSCSRCEGTEIVDCNVCLGTGTARDGKTQCHVCEGEGERDCQDCTAGTETCDSCDGSGCVDGAAEITAQTDLNGNCLWTDKSEQDRRRGQAIDRAWANLILSTYYARGAAKPAKPQPLEFRMETV